METKRRRLLMTGVAAGVLGMTGLQLRAQTRGGQLTAGLGGAHSTDSWDSRTHADTFMMVAGHGTVFDCLTEVAADGSLKGELAESWEASADAKTWVFNLRRGVTFHNGKPFVADDVLASINLHRPIGSGSPAAALLGAIEDIEKLTAHQVRFTLSAGNADFPYLMSDYHLVIYPANDLAKAMTLGIGTGLYRVEHFDPGSRFVGRRITDHYKADSAGFFDLVDYRAFNDSVHRMHALKIGQVDAVNRVDYRAANRLKNNRSVHLQTVSGNLHYNFAMQASQSPFDNADLRRALKYALDRQAMVDQILQGHGRIGNDTPIGPANQYAADDIAPFPYDPDRARYHIRKAGLEGATLTLTTSDALIKNASSAAELMQSQIAASGLTLKVTQSPADGYWSGAWRNAAFAAGYWSGRATEDWMLSMGHSARALWNNSSWKHPRLQSLINAARAELDSDIRRDQYREIQQILRDDGASLVPMFADYIQATTPRLHTPDTIGNLWEMDNARMAERWSVA